MPLSQNLPMPTRYAAHPKEKKKSTYIDSCLVGPVAKKPIKSRFLRVRKI